MKTREAKELGGRIAVLVQAGQMTQAYALLAPVLAERTPFTMLGHIGKAIGDGPLDEVNTFLKHIEATKTIGGWVVIGCALKSHLGRDLSGAYTRCRRFIIAGDIWYAADTLGERVPGPALVAQFQPALELLASWRADANRWVRRSVGVSVHFWAKRSRGAVELIDQADVLLTFLKPMFGEWEMDAVKGVGWGLKTLGKYYPELVADWLAQQVVPRQHRHRSLMLRKALTYLSKGQRARALGDIS